MSLTGAAQQELQFVNGIIANFTQARADLSAGISALQAIGSVKALADAQALKTAVDSAMAVLQKDADILGDADQLP